MDSHAIRTLLDSIQVLTESTGLAGRKPGASFVNPANGDTLVFNDLRFYPEEGGRFEEGDLDSALSAIERKLGAKIQWENARSKRTGGFAIATFTHDSGPFVVGTYLEQIKPVFTDNYVQNTILKTYKFAGAAAAKTQAGLTPQDLLTDQNDLSISSIMTQLSQKLGTDHPLYHVAHHVAMGEPLPLEINAPVGLSFTAFRDYFCEILQPIALQRGLFTGNAAEAARLFLDADGFADTSINFDASKNAGLSDSVLSASDGRSVKISSKGAAGAMASVRNLLDSINELSTTDDGKKLLRKYGEIVDMLDEIKRQGQAGAPLYLGVKFKIIDEAEADIIRGLIKARPADIRDGARLAVLGLTDNLVKLAQARGTETPGNTSLYYHLTAAVAHLAAEAVNERTNFGEAASTILNNGALVQVYTVARERAGKWVLEGFDSKYPGKSVSGVVLTASKNYFSTGIKGNFTFKILRGSAKAAPEDDTREVPANKVAASERDRALADKQATDDRAGRKRRKPM